MKKSGLGAKVFWIGLLGNIMYILGILALLSVVVLLATTDRFVWQLLVSGLSLLLNAFILEVIAEIGQKVADKEGG